MDFHFTIIYIYIQMFKEKLHLIATDYRQIGKLTMALFCPMYIIQWSRSNPTQLSSSLYNIRVCVKLLSKEDQKIFCFKLNLYIQNYIYEEVMIKRNNFFIKKKRRGNSLWEREKGWVTFFFGFAKREIEFLLFEKTGEKLRVYCDYEDVIRGQWSSGYRENSSAPI